MSAFLDISQVGLPIHTKDKNEIRFNCVFCDDDAFHLYINTRKRVYHCFRCGAAGRTNIGDFGLAEKLAFDRNKHIPDSGPIQLPKPYKDLLTPAGIRYLMSRGIYESDVERHKLYCAAPYTRYFGRVIIPNHARQGYCNYFVARSYTKIGFPRYLNPPGGRGILFLSPDKPDNYFPQYWGESSLLIVEGPFDYLKASRHGPTLALLGKELNNEQARTLVTKYSTIYIMLDQGTKESLAALKIQTIVRPYVDCHILQCPKKDPGEMNDNDFRELALALHLL